MSAAGVDGLDRNPEPRVATSTQVFVVSHLQAAVAADSTRADAHYALARAYLRTTRTTKGRKSADQAIRHNAKYAPPYLLLAKLYQREHKVEAAHAFYKNYLEQNPDDQTAAHAFAVELVKQKK